MTQGYDVLVNGVIEFTRLFLLVQFCSTSSLIDVFFRSFQHAFPSCSVSSLSLDLFRSMWQVPRRRSKHVHANTNLRGWRRCDICVPTMSVLVLLFQEYFFHEFVGGLIMQQHFLLSVGIAYLRDVRNVCSDIL